MNLQSLSITNLAARPIKSIKRGVKAAAWRAGMPDVSQYTLRHTAGVYMAQEAAALTIVAIIGALWVMFATIFRVAFQFAFTVAVLAIPVAAVVYLYRVMQ